MGMSDIGHQQDLERVVLQSVTANNATPPPVWLSGMGHNLVLVITNTDAAGTLSVTPQGSLDGSFWFNRRYQRVDNVASPTPAVGPIAVPAASSIVLELLGYADGLRLVTTGATGFTSGSVTATVYGLPV